MTTKKTPIDIRPVRPDDYDAIELMCYLQDLFTLAEERGHGVGRALINATYEIARQAGCKRVYWQTHTTNTPGRTLYDKVAKHFGFIVYAKDV